MPTCEEKLPGSDTTVRVSGASHEPITHFLRKIQATCARIRDEEEPITKETCYMMPRLILKLMTAKTRVKNLYHLPTNQPRKLHEHN